MLCGHTGYSDKVVRQGLSQLRSMGLAYRDAELRDWYLVPGTEVLALLRGALETTVHPGRTIHPASHAPGEKGIAAELSTELSTGAESGGETDELAAGEATTAARRGGKGMPEVGTKVTGEVAIQTTGAAVGIGLVVTANPMDSRKLAAYPRARIILSAVLKNAQFGHEGV